jgi:hypothetical protein
MLATIRIERISESLTIKKTRADKSPGLRQIIFPE